VVHCLNGRNKANANMKIAGFSKNQIQATRRQQSRESGYRISVNDGLVASPGTSE
jgi:uncharacterized protein YbgA (DUF1722 family)